MKKKKKLPAYLLRLRWFYGGVIAAALVTCRYLTPVLALPMGIAFLILFRKERHRGHPAWGALGAAVLLMWMGVYTLLFLTPVMTLYGQTVELTATVTDYPTENRFSLTVPVSFRPENGLPVKGIAYLNTEEVLLPGDTVRFSATLDDPNDTSSDTPHYYRSVGVFFVAQKSKIVEIKHKKSIPLRFWPEQLRLCLNRRIMLLFDGETADFFRALLTGDQSALSDRMRARLNRLGMRHILAVSGLHIGFLTALVLLLPLPIQLRQGFAVVLLVMFCLMTGARPSVVRAVVMAACVLLASFLQRDSDPWTSMGAALLILLLRNPFSIEDVGLQLSFLSVVGILLFTGPILEWMLSHLPEPKKKVVNALRIYICGSFSVTLGALFLTLPLIGGCYGVFSVIAPVTNLLTLWAVELGFIFGALSVAISFVSMPLGMLLALPARFFLGYVLLVIQLFTELGNHAAVTKDVFLFCVWLLAGYGYITAAWWDERLRKYKKQAISLLALGLLSVFILHQATLLSSGLAVEVLDVGQGQSILCLSEQEAAAIDCGGVGAGASLAAHMEDVGEYQLDLLVLTHLDSDHINGLPVLLDEVTVKAIWIPESEEDKMQEISALTEEYEVEVRTIRKDSTFSFGTASLQCFAPVWKDKEKDNDMGLSVLVEKEDFSFLITGDMDIKTEEKLIKRHPIHADVLVVGHHGSATSTGNALLEQVAPKRAIISVGKGNSYGHPAEDTLVRLIEAGCVIQRTDVDGTVVVKAS